MFSTFRRWGVFPSATRPLQALYWTHRWLGVLGCLLFAMWFVSGVVMTYVGFPALTDTERRAGLAPLMLVDARVPASAAMDGLPGPPRRLSLDMLLDEPVWRIVDANGVRHTESARDGRQAGATGAARAERIARQFSGHPDARWVETLARDEWTESNALDPLRPLHRIAVGDDAGTELYVSALTGEVVRDTTRRERFWNWLGAVPHRLRFTPSRADSPWWHDAVRWIAGASIVSAVAGAAIGWWRERRQWHGRGCIAWRGAGALLLLASAASGGWSMAVHRGFANTPAPVAQAGPMPSLLPRPPDGAREVRVSWLSGRPLLQWHDAAGPIAVTGLDGAPVFVAQDDILRAAVQERPGAAVASAALLTQPDAHWFGNPVSHPVPVWRIVFADAESTWLHLDPASGQVLGRSDRVSRLKRWLFDGAHRLAFPWLVQHRPAWDMVVLVLSASGFAVSVRGVVAGWRRARRASTVPALARQCRKA